MSLLQSSLPAKFAFTGITKTLDKSTTDLSIMQLLENCELIIIDESIKDFGNPLTEISFRISPEFRSLKGLFNGFISLGQPKGVNLSYRREMDTYILKINTSGQTATSNYLIKLIKMIEDELRFKTVLKTILENQKAFDASQQLLRKEIFK